MPKRRDVRLLEWRGAWDPVAVHGVFRFDRFATLKRSIEILERVDNLLAERLALGLVSLLSHCLSRSCSNARSKRALIIFASASLMLPCSFFPYAVISSTV